jgi:YegS C-terminal NAD kinase beta sandwich-like domain
MTVGRNAGWGAAGTAPDPLAVCVDDAALFAVLNDPTRDRGTVPTVALTGGDLWRTLGGIPNRPPPEPGGQAMLVTTDLGAVTIDGVEHLFASHVVARRRWWRGELVALMNAQYLGRWDVAPRSHPNDGRLDLVHVAAEMTTTDRCRARRRLATGTHVPHPAIEQRRLTAVALDLARPLDIAVDGVPFGRQRRIDVRVRPDALIVAI